MKALRIFTILLISVAMVVCSFSFFESLSCHTYGWAIFNVVLFVINGLNLHNVLNNPNWPSRQKDPPVNPPGCGGVG